VNTLEQTKVSILGLGYIGLPTAAVLAESGYQVNGVDINTDVVMSVNLGAVHFFEPDLAELVTKGVQAGRLTASNDAKEADVHIICVPTPLITDGTTHPRSDISHVLAAAHSIAKVLKDGDLVILESTSPVGTTSRVKSVLQNELPHLNFCVAYCPERVLPGKILVELTENNRIVGGSSLRCAEAAAEFYRSFVVGEVRKTDDRTAEMCKLTENAYRDVNIAFANELSLLAESAGVDVWNLIGLANLHPRVNVLRPGIGVGGHCIAVDPWFLAEADADIAKLIITARKVNDSRPITIVENIQPILSKKLVANAGSLRVCCFGLAFKPDIDDLRESPAVEIVKALERTGVDICVVEPHISHSSSFDLCTIEEALENMDFGLVLVAHSYFRSHEGIKDAIEAGRLVDLTGLYSA